MVRLAATVILAVVLAGCGFVGEPLPPSLKLPSPVRDLSARQRGDKLVVEFTRPELTTDGLALKNPPRLELRIGAGPSPFRPETWAAQARVFAALPNGETLVRYQVPAAEWAGREVLLAVQAFGPTDRSAGWSNFAVVTVVTTLNPPQAVRVENVAKGLLVRWSGKAPFFRIHRKSEGDESAVQAARVQGSEWLDTGVEWGKRYTYTVQSLAPANTKEAESEFSAEAGAVREDRFPPPVPAGLTAVVSTGSIELSWDRGPDQDLAGYRVYRAAGEGAWERIADAVEGPSYSDRKLERQTVYRYAVSAVDRVGNESEKSAPVEVTAP